jgi:hypothetical protein
MPWRKCRRDVLRPLDRDDGTRCERLVEADRFEFFLAPMTAHAPGVDVDERAFAGMIHSQRERGAGDGFGIGAKAARETAHERRLASAEVA